MKKTLRIPSCLAMLSSSSSLLLASVIINNYYHDKSWNILTSLSGNTAFIISENKSLVPKLKLKICNYRYVSRVWYKFFCSLIQPASDFFPYQSTETNHLPHNRYQVRECVKLRKLGKTSCSNLLNHFTWKRKTTCKILLQIFDEINRSLQKLQFSMTDIHWGW